jgi:[ribosomal protein S5]-alanine N-acetyltransferase
VVLNGTQSERLLFRKLEPEDFDVWLKGFHNHPESNKYWLVENKDPVAMCRSWFSRTFHRYENNLGGMNVLIHKESGDFIGQCGLLLQTVDQRDELEVAYSILPAFWNQGYATEAALTCIQYAFDQTEWPSLISIIHEKNIESEKVALKNGLTLDKRTTYDNNPVKIYRVRRLTD